MHVLTHSVLLSSQGPAEAKDKLERAHKAIAVMASPEAFLNICLGDAITGKHEVIDDIDGIDDKIDINNPPFWLILFKIF